jgi:hypothetical protein
MILRDQWIDRELRTIQNKMAHPSLTELEQHNLVRQQTELRQLKGQPLSSPELQPSRSAIDESETNKE